jgi:hypothetical protein
MHRNVRSGQRPSTAQHVDNEMTREGARYTLHRGTSHIFIVAMPGLTEVYTVSPAAQAQYAEELGRRADDIAAADPLLTPSRAVEELQAVTPPAGNPPMPGERIIRLATAASQAAALSSRLVLYPRGMEAGRALKLGIGSLLGPKELTGMEVRQRIASRYPAAESIPDAPLLERLREACGQKYDAPGFIVLIAADEQRHMPVLDGKPIPVILTSEWTRTPEAWLENVHRGGQQLPTSMEQ